MVDGYPGKGLYLHALYDRSHVDPELEKGSDDHWMFVNGGIPHETELVYWYHLILVQKTYEFDWFFIQLHMFILDE